VTWFEISSRLSPHRVEQLEKKKKAGGYAGLPGRDPSSLSP
jgi:hypothetical protein